MRSPTSIHSLSFGAPSHIFSNVQELEAFAARLVSETAKLDAIEAGFSNEQFKRQEKKFKEACKEQLAQLQEAIKKLDADGDGATDDAELARLREIEAIFDADSEKHAKLRQARSLLYCRELSLFLSLSLSLSLPLVFLFSWATIRFRPSFISFDSLIFIVAILRLTHSHHPCFSTGAGAQESRYCGRDACDRRYSDARRTHSGINRSRFPYLHPACCITALSISSTMRNMVFSAPYCLRLFL